MISLEGVVVGTRSRTLMTLRRRPDISSHWKRNVSDSSVPPVRSRSFRGWPFKFLPLWGRLFRCRFSSTDFLTVFHFENTHWKGSCKYLKLLDGVVEGSFPYLMEHFILILFERTMYRKEQISTWKQPTEDWNWNYNSWNQPHYWRFKRVYCE